MKYFRWCSSILFFALICHLTTIAEENVKRTSEHSLVYDGNESTEQSIDDIPPTTEPDFTEPCPKSNCSDYSLNNNETIYDRVIDRSCHCDKKCLDYRDCCADSRYYNEEEQRKPSQYECRKYDFNWYFTKTVCPTTWTNKKIREKCSMSEDYSNLNIEEIELRIPATSLKTNITYGNIYCALCNYESFVKLWKIKIEYNCHYDHSGLDVCSNLKNSTVNEIQFKNNRWFFVYNGTIQYIILILRSPENMTFEHCQSHSIISSCPSTWTDLDMKVKCSGPYLRVTDLSNGNIYKNEYCAYCNGANESNLSCHIPYSRSAEITPYSVSQSFTILFDYKLGTSLLPLCHQDQTSLNEQTCLLEANTTQTSSTNDNWFFTAYTSIAISLSLLFLVIHLIIFSYVQELHSIGGKCIASYCIALTLAYGTFLLTSFVDGVICTTVAILIYYFFISAFTWMLTISYDLWKTFWNATKHLRSPSNSKKTFILYSLWSWSAPLIPVLISTYLHVSSSDSNLAPHFDEGSCWFKNGYSLLIFFVCPVCVIIIVNFALFLHTSIMVRSSQCQSVNQKSQVDFRLFARIALLTGITWITGFFGGYTQKPVIWFIFIVLNTAQGVLIFIAFSCKKRIIYSFLKRAGICENWQNALQDSVIKSSDSKSTTMTTTVSKNS